MTCDSIEQPDRKTLTGSITVENQSKLEVCRGNGRTEACASREQRDHQRLCNVMCHHCFQWNMEKQRCHFDKAVLFDKTTRIKTYIQETNIPAAVVGEKYFFSLKVKPSTLE